MIKKDIKTLSEFRNPTPEPRWRIHLSDGSHIDVTGETERNATIIQLLRTGRIENWDSIRAQQLNGVQSLNLNVTINRTEEPVVERKTFLGLLKEEMVTWSWESFITRFVTGMIIPIITLIIQYLTGDPIKLGKTETMSFFQALPWGIGFGLGMNVLLWSIWKSWKLLPFITCWLKIAVFIVIFVLCMLTVGLINETISDKIMDFIGRHFISERELKILKTTTE
jgi:hypothetical protein